MKTELNRMGRIRLFPLLFQNGCSQSSRFLPQARRIVGSGDENVFAAKPFSSPEPTILLACGRNREALGATISGMRHRCRLRETGWAEFGYFLCYFKMVAPRALDSCRRPEGSQALGTRMQQNTFRRYYAGADHY